MEVINWELISQLTAGALVVIALIIMSNTTKAQNAAMAAMSDASIKSVVAAVNSSVQTHKEALDGQRLFYQSKVDDLFKELLGERQERKSEVEKLQKRISDLECEVDAKDKRIETLEDENSKLKAELERVKGLLSNKQDKARKQEKKAA